MALMLEGPDHFLLGRDEFNANFTLRSSSSFRVGDLILSQDGKLDLTDTKR